MIVYLRGGEELKIKKVAGGGYIAAPIGALFLEVQPSRALVGKYVVKVIYPDNTPGVIPQEEILTIKDQRGNKVEYGNSLYPGHPKYDPRNPAPDPKEYFKKKFGDK